MALQDPLTHAPRRKHLSEPRASGRAGKRPRHSRLQSGPSARALGCQPPAALAQATGEPRPTLGRPCCSHLGSWQAFAPKRETADSQSFGACQHQRASSPTCRPFSERVMLEREALSPHFPTTAARCHRVTGPRDPSLEREGPGVPGAPVSRARGGLPVQMAAAWRDAPSSGSVSIGGEHPQ